MAPDLPPLSSASQLVAYTMCPRKYAFHYVYDLEPEFTSTALVLGSAVHSAVGWYFEERLAGRTPTIARAKDILTADLLAATSTDAIRWKTATPDSLEAEGHALLGLYLTTHGELSVSQVEAPFQVDLEDPETGEIVGRPMRGFFDLVLTDQTMIELKTSAKGWNEFDLIRHLQVGAYAFAGNALHGGPSALEVHVLVKLKKEPRLETYRVERGEPSTRWWFEAARAIEAAIEARAFPPKPSPLCRECEYERACAAWVGEAPTLAAACEDRVDEATELLPIAALVRNPRQQPTELVVHP